MGELTAKHHRYYAETICKQIEAYASLGSILRAILRRSTPIVALDDNRDRRGGAVLTLKPGGRFWLWKIEIELTWLDLYRVRLWKIGRTTETLGQNEKVAEIDGIYADVLGSIVLDYARQAGAKVIDLADGTVN